MISQEGLDPEIRRAAEESFKIARPGKTQVAVPPAKKAERPPAERPLKDYFADYEPVRRPRRPSSRRHF
jgi:hypothetical protein